MPQLRDNRGVTPRHAPKVPFVMSSGPGSCAFGSLLSCSREARGAAGTRWTNAPLSWRHPLQTQQDCFPPAAPLPSAMHAASCTSFVSSCPPRRHTRGEVLGPAPAKRFHRKLCVCTRSRRQESPLAQPSSLRRILPLRRTKAERQGCGTAPRDFSSWWPGSLPQRSQEKDLTVDQ